MVLHETSASKKIFASTHSIVFKVLWALHLVFLKISFHLRKLIMDGGMTVHLSVFFISEVCVGSWRNLGIFSPFMYLLSKFHHKYLNLFKFVRSHPAKIFEDPCSRISIWCSIFYLNQNSEDLLSSNMQLFHCLPAILM